MAVVSVEVLFGQVVGRATSKESTRSLRSYLGSGDASGEAFRELVELDCDVPVFVLPELDFRDALGRMTTSCGWLDVLIGMRVTTGPVGRECDDEEDFLLLSLRSCLSLSLSEVETGAL